MTRPFRFAMQMTSAPTGAEWLDLARRFEAGVRIAEIAEHVAAAAYELKFLRHRNISLVSSIIRVGPDLKMQIL